MAKFDKQKMRERLDSLTGEAEKIRKKAAPLREEWDAMRNRHREDEARLAEKIAKAEEGLFDIEQERAFLSRGLGSA